MTRIWAVVVVMCMASCAASGPPAPVDNPGHATVVGTWTPICDKKGRPSVQVSWTKNETPYQLLVWDDARPPLDSMKVVRLGKDHRLSGYLLHGRPLVRTNSDVAALTSDGDVLRVRVQSDGLLWIVRANPSSAPAPVCVPVPEEVLVPDSSSPTGPASEKTRSSSNASPFL